MAPQPAFQIERMALDLIKATALILALSLLQGFNARFWGERHTARAIGSGLIFGVMCVVGMMMPITLTPGVIFDGRSAVLSMAALFGGPLVGAIAGAVAAAYRLHLGGDGALIGVGVISISVKRSVPIARLPFTPATTVLKLSKVPNAICRTVPPCGAAGLT